MNPSSAGYSYAEFCDFVRRFNQEGLLTAAAQQALALADNASQPGYARTPPWVLAAIVKASICHGNPHRSTTVRPHDLVIACHMHDNPSPRELTRPEFNSAFAILARTAYEQFPYQESVFENMARPQAFFDDYSGRKTLEVINKTTLAELIGAPLNTALGVAILLHTSAYINKGFFEPAWLQQPNFDDVLAVLPREEIMSVIDAVFATSFDEFKTREAAAAKKAPLPFLDRYSFNPLAARPIIRMDHNRLLAPVPQLIPRKLSPIELYYNGLGRWGTRFTNDLGELLEDYTGRQLATLPDAHVTPEVKYTKKKQEFKSVDWIVVFKDLVLLVEAKATRAPAGTRAGDNEASNTYARVLGEAFTQLNRDHKAILDGASHFDFIPKDRPIMGMVATLDPWYIANSLARPFMPTTNLPIAVASISDIEHLVAIGQRRPASALLTEIMHNGDERQTWELGVALSSYYQAGDRNPLLEHAWNRLPFSRHAKRKASPA
jgi:hypothetical protein